MAEDVLVAFCTFPNGDTARDVARELVERRLAACGNVVSQVHSVYRWEGKVESGDEALAIFKLTSARYVQFEATLRSLHPYEVPEIISFRIDGLPDYLRWVAESCSEIK